MPKSKKSPTRGQKKLASLNLKLPMLPLTTAGSLPKHVELAELRYKVSKGFATNVDLERRERLSTEGWLREQSKLGLDVLVDGEMNRGDLTSYFAKKINGFEAGGSVRIYGNRYFQKPVIKSKISWKEPLVSSFWHLNQRTIQKPVKAVITGAYTLMDSCFNDFYRTREEALQDLTAVIRQEIDALTDAGAKIIQIDEVAFGARPEELELVKDSIKKLTKNQKAYFILRLGYDDIQSLWSKIEDCPVDNFYFEGANSNFSWFPAFKKSPTEKDLTVGVIDSHSHIIEDILNVEKRIKACLKVIPAARLWIATDDGLKTRTPEEASGKLNRMAAATLKIRQKLPA